MKVMYVLASTGMTGATISFENMLVGLIPKGVKAVVVLPRGKINKYLKNFLIENDIKYYQYYPYFSIKGFTTSFIVKILRNLGCSNLYSIYKNYKSTRNLLKIIKKENPDIIHTNVGIIHNAFHIAKKKGIPHVWHLREYQTEDFKFEILPSFKSFCKELQESYVITITKDIRKYFNLDYSKKTYVIYNGIFSKVDTCSIYPKKEYFLCASRIVKSKGFEDVITAFSAFSKIYPHYILKIAGYGDEDYINDIKKLSKDLGIIEKIEFLGFQNNIKNLMAEARALIVASYNEGFGRMTAEAAFCSCLIIGRDTGGTKEILESVGGLSFLDCNGLEKCMLESVELSDNDYKLITTNAKQNAQRLYSIENNVESIYTVYNKMLENKISI